MHFTNKNYQTYVVQLPQEDHHHVDEDANHQGVLVVAPSLTP